MKRILAAFWLISVLFSQPLMASPDSRTLNTPLVGERIKPCDWWTYSSDVQGYVCRNNPWYIEVPTVRDVQSLVDALNAKIRDLEARVRALENAQ